MALNSYAALQTAIGTHLVRTDMAAIAPDLIALAEADMGDKLRVSEMEARTALTLDAEYVDLPADWLQTIRLTYNGASHRILDLANPREADQWVAVPGEPRIYSVEGLQLRFFPTPSSGTADLQYYQRIPALSDSNTTNWLLVRAPDAYLYGALVHSAPYLQEDARIATWGQLYDRAIDRLQRASDRARAATGARRR